MATSNSTTGTPRAPRGLTLHQAAHNLCASLQPFFDLAEREILAHNSTDFDGIEFLVKAAKTEFFRFSELIPENEEGKFPYSGLSNKGPHPGSFEEGAAACLAALQRAEAIAEHNPKGDYFQDRDEAMAEIMRAAGDIPHHAAGALAVLAEYFVGGCQFGQYDIACWKPEVMMSDEERTAYRESINAACA